jgi:outer membrane protein
MKPTSKQWWVIAILALPLFIQAQQTATPAVHQFTVAQAVAYAQKNNVQVKNALLDVQKQVQVNREVTGMAYPQISGSVSTTYNPNVATQVIPNFISPATYQVLVDEGVKDGNGNTIQMPGSFDFIAAQFGTKWSANGGVSLNQIIFDGQVFTGLQARKTLIDFQQKNVEVTEEVIKANVHKIYYQLVVSKTQLELIDSNISLLNKLLHDTKIMYDNGFAEKLDINKSTVQIANLQTEKNNVLTQVANGYLGLKVLMGMPVNDSLVLVDKIDDDIIKEDMLAAGVFDYSERKEYQYAQLGIKLGEYDIQRYKLSAVPTLSLNGMYSKSAQRNKFNFFKSGQDWFDISAITLNLNIPIFKGFATSAKIAQARIELQKSKNLADALKLNIDNEIQTAKNNFVNAINSLDNQKKNMGLAEEVYQQTKKKYEVGTGSQIEINTAQNDLKLSQTNYVNALYNAIVAKVDYLKATGKL